MILNRRTFATLALATVSGWAAAQQYPSKPIQVIVPYGPGGASDLVARLLAEKMPPTIGQTVVVQNRPGANGNIALDFVARAPGDGYTLLLGNVGPNAINPALYPPSSIKFDAIKSFVPIVQTGNVPMVLVASADLPVKNVGELLEYARKQPKPMIFATGGQGAATHMSSALIELLGHVKFEHVQYKGDPLTLADMIGGQVQLGMVTLPALQPFLGNPKLRLLGVTTKQRTPTLSDVPTIAESGIPSYDSSSWGGVLAPAGTPPEIVAKLNKAIVSILREKSLEAQLRDMGVDVVANSPQEFASFLEEEIKRWRSVVKQTGITIQ